MTQQTTTRGTTEHKVVSQSEWVTARKAFLDEEKRFTRLRDQLSQHRRELPWVRVDKEYVFLGPNGKETLAQLFDGKSQLIVYHFMFGLDWKEGCPACSFWADNFNGIVEHLKHRDTTMLAISHAPLDKINEFKKRMGWSFKWVSAADTDFNYDFQVSFRPEDSQARRIYYNYDYVQSRSTENPGISTFYKDQDGVVYHTYSAYARGLDLMNTAYNYLDLTAKGRDENSPETEHGKWIRHHDKYDA